MRVELNLQNRSNKNNTKLAYGNAVGKPVRVMLDEIDRIHLNDKVSFVLNKLDKDEFLVVSPNMDNSLPIIGRLLSVFEKHLKGLYHIQNDKFPETVILSKQDSALFRFDNFNDYPVRMNTVDVQPYFGINLRQGDRIWGSTLRSIFIKEPDIPADLLDKSLLFRNQYDFDVIRQLADDVNSPVRQFAHHRRKR